MTVSTHVLDTGRGQPASGVLVELFQAEELVATGVTGSDGRIADFAAELDPGSYRLVFHPESDFFARVELEVALGDGYVALYAHLADWQVRTGQHVATGQRLGTAGCTGSCTGTHLHFELRHDGQAVNPLRFFRKAQKSGVRRSASFCFRSGGISSTAACRTNMRNSSSNT